MLPSAQGLIFQMLTAQPRVGLDHTSLLATGVVPFQPLIQRFMMLMFYMQRSIFCQQVNYE